MKINELSVGNYTDHKVYGNVEVTAIFDTGQLEIRTSAREIRIINISEIKPIPLDIDGIWLKLLGFKVGKQQCEYTKKLKNCVVKMFYYDAWNLSIKSKVVDVEMADFFSVHNFQNIILQITEVKLKLK